MKINKKIPVFDFKIGMKEKEFVNDCLETSFIGQGSYVNEFEKKFSNFVNCKYGVNNQWNYGSTFSMQNSRN